MSNTQFEQCKQAIDAAGKAIVKAETTLGVLSKQMETLKARRKQIEDSCLADIGVSIKELQSTLDEKIEEYSRLSAIVQDKYEQISQAQGVNGKPE